MYIKINIKRQLDNFTKITIQSSIKQMKKLLKNYVEKGYLGCCPLCRINRDGYQISKMRCDICPWGIILNVWCVTYFTEHYNTDKDNNVINNHDSIAKARNEYMLYRTWNKNRIKQLKKWIKIYKLYYKQRFNEKYKEN